ncbi:lymphocyte expansion molecule-like [Polistes fuscatus]|uniref:lymphocyte expansion molecule-like n=1 Tax=Polistes fuscatus TaxID=30207 RepID=UPI001CA92B33|nr:lymphocyte expansion molecule-like [Polistes fuscatus]
MEKIESLKISKEEEKIKEIEMRCDFNTKTFKLCRCACKWRCKCLIPRKKKPSPAFNSATGRDGMIGLHPKLYTSSSDAPSVGRYNILPIKSKGTAISWKKELETKQFSVSLGGRHLESRVIQRKLMISGRGPGTHEIEQWPENVLNKRCKSIRDDIGFGTARRFKTVYTETPGPGYTFKVHNPYYYLELNRLKGLSSLPTFEYDGLVPRFREIQRDWSLPCNRYDVKDPRFLEAVLKKVTGKRGPYDLFTGPRDESTIKGYLGRKMEDYLGWPVSLPGEVEKLVHKSTYYKGRISNCPRFPKINGTRMALKDINMCYKNPNDPGPGHYNPSSPRKPMNRMKYPFDSNIKNVRPIFFEEIPGPGPGRYKLKETRLVKGNGWTWVFKSNVPRTMGAIIPKPYNDF